MRVNFFNQLGSISDGPEQGLTGTITGPLILHSDPTSPLQAATKHYVEQKTNNLDASSLKSGVLPTPRLPGLSGDVQSTAGTGILRLSPTGVVPGTYTKLLVTAKGRVQSGGQLTDSDIPVFSWNKITSDKPTTLDGYGIVDGVNKSGGTINGVIKLENTPTNPLHAANLEYVSSKLGNTGTFATGDVIRRRGPGATGWMPLNGGTLPQASFPNLYALIGNTFDRKMNPGNGKPWQQQYAINTSQETNIGTLNFINSFPITISTGQVIVTKNRAYLFGGISGTTTLNSVYTCTINNEGVLSSWTRLNTHDLPVAMAGHQAVVTKNTVYLIGGTDGVNVSRSVYYCSIDSVTGDLVGTWQTGNLLPEAISLSQSFVTRNKVYLVGGRDTVNSSSKVYSATYDISTGILGAWETETNLPGPLRLSCSVITKNRVYMVGGYNGTSFVNTVYTAPILDNGNIGTWTVGIPFPIDIGSAQVVVTQKRVFILGGTTGALILRTIYSAPINPDGTIGTWELSPAQMAYETDNTHVIVTKYRVYTIGGRRQNATHALIQYTNFSGGFNDYSDYITNTYAPTLTGFFQLPNLTATKGKVGFESFLVKT